MRRGSFPKDTTMGKYADLFQADLAAIHSDLEDFQGVLVDASDVRWTVLKDTVDVSPITQVDGTNAGYAFSVWLQVPEHCPSTAVPQAHTIVTVDGTQYEVASRYMQDQWSVRLDLRTVN